MFISKIILENFQAFERGEFDLSPNLNILVGVSNVGKSSVARALSLVLFNQWDKSWCRFGAKYCRVSLLTNTGIEVIREKGEKVNRYILRLPGQPEQLFEAFGTGVPEQVQQALRIHAVQVDTTDTLNLNLAGQMDALFLLSQTGSYRAKVLGKLSGATYLDHAIRELNKDKRQITAEKNTKDLEITETQAQVDKFSVIEAYSDAISALGARLDSLTRSQERIERIRNLFERRKVVKDAWIRTTQKADILGPLDLTFSDQFDKRVDKLKMISLLSSKVVSFKHTYEQENKLNALLNAVDLSSVGKVTEKANNFKVKKDLAIRLVDKLGLITLVTSDLEQAEQDYKETAKQYTDMLRDNGVCPTCNQSTNHLCVQ